ncbi:DUF4167 domain-containing protein [Phenylobacterium sp.]|jgi:hypothetical protein|uniref:DUF4167 domain-containing protein n=1 Tax=Phenylobacterium sp. TaxID=1871053 RepID=UPI0008C15BF1|nr:DUF4167 domain-containing protein [Phenylobacterium sp.]MBA4794017.1 DUF4167 domain-containing protein [Phenylobacterium sp.]OHB39087.1 MAG: hypothetical protein A2882_08665 [Phenylobacterium sp. RIFCSPHIGHO2_01_FULL_70_10]
MRDFKGMKRQRGRNRGGGGGKPQHNANRAFDSNGPEGVKVRGNAQHVFEKYQQLARDATSSGDRVLAENYLQHAEHYFRLLRAMQPQRSPSDILGRDQASSGLDIDFEDESGQAQVSDSTENGETEGGNDGEGRERGGREREEARRDRGDRDRNDREGGREGRRDRWRDRDERRDRGERQERGERAERPDPMAVVEPQASPLGGEGGQDGPMLRDAEGGASEAPAFLQARPERDTGEEPARKPRRRRAPRSFEGGEGASASETEEA